MRKNFILSELETKGIVTYKGKGNSMTPRIKSGGKVTVKKVLPGVYRKDDMVYCKVKGSYFLHLITAIKNNRYQISNNHNHINGWIGINSIFGLCIAVEGKEIISAKDIFKRLAETIGDLSSTVLASAGPLKNLD